MSFPGFFFASATSSFTDFAGTDGCITSIIGALAIVATGTMDRAGSNGSLIRTEAVAGYEEVWPSSVCPSGSVRVAISVPIMPLAPGRLSTTTFLPHASVSLCATARLMMSIEPPAV